MIVGQPGENAGSQEYLVYIACAAFFDLYKWKTNRVFCGSRPTAKNATIFWGYS